MAFTRVGRNLKQSDQSQATYSPTDGTYTHTYTEWWFAVTDNLSTTASEVKFASDGTNTVPLVGSVRTIGAISYWCVGVLPTKTGPNTWDVQISYSISSSKPPSGERWAILITIDDKPWEQEAFTDQDGDPVVNSAGQYFNPSLKEENTDILIGVEWQTTHTDILDLISARGRVNGSPLTISIKGFNLTCAARTLKLEKVTATTTYDVGSSAYVWKISAKFAYRDDVYTDEVPDRGFCELKENEDGDKKLYPILGENHLPINEPAYLDGSGRQLIIDPSSDTPTPPFIWEYKIQKEADLGSILSRLS